MLALFVKDALDPEILLKRVDFLGYLKQLSLGINTDNFKYYGGFTYNGGLMWEILDSPVQSYRPSSSYDDYIWLETSIQDVSLGVLKELPDFQTLCKNKANATPVPLECDYTLEIVPVKVLGRKVILSDKNSGKVSTHKYGQLAYDLYDQLYAKKLPIDQCAQLIFDTYFAAVQYNYRVTKELLDYYSLVNEDDLLKIIHAAWDISLDDNEQKKN